MTNTYVLSVVLQDTNDEFSETFNPKDPADVEALEKDILEAIENANYSVESVDLTRVIVDI